MEGVIIVARPGARCLVRRGEETLATVSLAAASSSAADHVFSDQIAIDITTDHRAITVACTWPSGETLAKSFEYRPNTIIADGPLGCVSLPPHPTAAERKEHKACLARPRSFSYAYDAYPQFMRVYD
ncbi:MAG: hypothetical protein JWP35_3251 [Caulobacter sp.]|nr:hypothetical protein [Caulobacter sp.]